MRGRQGREGREAETEREGKGGRKSKQGREGDTEGEKRRVTVFQEETNRKRGW